MMTPKDKAKELFLKMSSHPYDNAKQCALITVYEIIITIMPFGVNPNIESLTLEYWQEVKNEIEKL